MYNIYILYMTEYFSAIKKNIVLPFATTQMDFEGIMSSEINQRKANTISLLYVDIKKQNPKNKQQQKPHKSKLIDIENRLVVARGGGGGMVEVSEEVINLLKIFKNLKNLLQIYDITSLKGVGKINLYCTF